MFLLSLTISDWLVTVVGIPFVTASIYAHRWLFAHVGCISYAFIMTFLGLNSLMSHAVIAVDRYLVITKPHFGIVVTYPKAFLMISIPWVFSFAWAVFPLAGWGEFTYEGTGAWCSVKWDSDQPQIMSYVLAMMFLTFISSIVIMMYCYICIFLTTRRMPRWATSNSIKTHERNRRRREQKLLKTLIAIAIAFLVAWSPYAITSMIVVFGGSELLSLTATTLPSLFAKSSVMINPIIYAVTSRVFRKSLKKMLTSFFPGCMTYIMTDKSPPSSSRPIQLGLSSDSKLKKDDQTSSCLVPGNYEICAAAVPVPPSAILPKVNVEPSGNRLSAAIEMERLNKLLPGKHGKGRPPYFGRRASDIGIPETGYKTVVKEVTQLDEESQNCVTAEGAVEVIGDRAKQNSVSTDNCSLELNHIIDGIHGKYAGIKQDVDDEEEDTSCDQIKEIPVKEPKKLSKLDKTSCSVVSAGGKEDKRKTAIAIDYYSSQSSVNADSGVFETSPNCNTAKKSQISVQRQIENEI
ncbi:rhodopsin [Strongylocentrotus purpuratus]|uniref:G-protein coupled receptors family 1 profile domain-containing protein n=1 Tax=Strongylocentrotus purpuratus TaxID=7668 RepID=A0A7M7NPP2_STRPU|nr:rhodopsin [Strongylocentrotus purpuratus]